MYVLYERSLKEEKKLRTKILTVIFNEERLNPINDFLLWLQ
jgi:hypothetical protein